MQEFDLNKIQNAIQKALDESKEGGAATAATIAGVVLGKIHELYADTNAVEDNENLVAVPTIEEIQDCVEMALMEAGLFTTAKGYILFRDSRNKSRKRDIFKARKELKPYEYPELNDYIGAIRHSYWIHTEFNYTSDIQDFKVNVTETEREAITRAMLAISQMEVAVKNFWGDLHHKLPKPEIGAVGATFAESEVRHADAYAHLLEILGLNDQFDDILSVPVLRERFNYLTETAAVGKTADLKDYTKSIILFSLLIEHVSLFSQFLIIMSFNKHKNLFKGVSNVVEATSKEEQIHGMFGIELVGIIREEHPEWFTTDSVNEIEQFCRDAYKVEAGVIDWIFEKGDLDFLPKQQVKEFVKHRLNNSLESIGFERWFETDAALVEETDWFDNEVIATKHVDFFQKRSINYNKRSQSITGNDLFD